MRSQKREWIQETERPQDRTYSLLSLILALVLYPLALAGLKQLSTAIPGHSFESSPKVVTLGPEEIKRILKNFEQKEEPKVEPEPVKTKPIAAVTKPRKVKSVKKTTATPKEVKSQKALLPSSWLPSKSAGSVEKTPATGSQTNMAFAPTETSGFGFQVANPSEARAELFKVESATPQVYDEKLVKKDLAPADGLLLKPSKKEFEIRGGLDAEIIRGIVAEHIIELRYCYETLLLKDPAAAGDVMTVWQIDGEGVMTSIAYESEALGASDLIPCIDGKMKKWRFPKPEGGGQVQVRYPFRFFR